MQQEKWARIRGGMYGLLIGDALGVPYEFSSPANIPAVWEHRFVIAIVIVGTMCHGGVSSAMAKDMCVSQGPESALSEDGESRLVARTLVAYIDKTWEIATQDTPIKDSVSRADDPSGNGPELEYHEVRFANFEAGFYRYDDGSAMRSVLSTMSSRFRLPCGLKIGQSQARVKELLGPPTYRQPDLFVYGTGGDLNAEVTFSFAGGRLKKMTWTYDNH